MRTASAARKRRRITSRSKRYSKIEPMLRKHNTSNNNNNNNNVIIRIVRPFSKRGAYVYITNKWLNRKVEIRLLDEEQEEFSKEPKLFRRNRLVH